MEIKVLARWRLWRIPNIALIPELAQCCAVLRLVIDYQNASAPSETDVIAAGSIEDDMKRLRLNRTVSLESFFAVAQMAMTGFGHGLVPEGVARTLGPRPADWVSLEGEGLNRPVRFVARKSMFSRPLVQNYYQAVKELADKL